MSAKKRLRIQLLLFLSCMGLTIPVNAADIPVMTTENPASMSDITSSTTIDLNSNGGFSNVSKGENPVSHSYSPGSYNDMFQEQYVKPQKEWQEAKEALIKAQRDADADPNNTDLKNALEMAKQNESAKHEAYDAAERDNASTIGVAGKLYNISSDDVEKLKGFSSSVSYNYDKSSYVDPVTGKSIEFNIRNNFVDNAGTAVISGAPSKTYYDPNPKQYDNMHIANISGENTTVTINGDKERNANNTLNAISKNSGMFNVSDGATLNIDSYISYNTGEGRAVSQKPNTSGTESVPINIANVTWKGQFTTDFGTFNVHDAASANSYNDALIKYIKTNEQFRLNHNKDSIQNYYNEQINKMYSLGDSVHINGMYKWDPAVINGIPNLNSTDVGLKPVSNNYFIGMKGNNTIVNLWEDSTIDAGNSSGTIIKSTDLEDTSGTGRKINIAGKLLGSSAVAINSVNTDVKVSTTGYIQGSTIVKSGSVDNEGKIGSVTVSGIDGDNSYIHNHPGATSGSITMTNGTVTNDEGSTVEGSIFGYNHTTIENHAKVSGSIFGYNHTTINNTADIKGSIGGNNVNITNSGTAAGIWGVGNSRIDNKHTLVGKNILDITDSTYIGKSVNHYIGYDISTYTNQGSDPVELQKSPLVSVSDYTGILSGGESTLDLSGANVYLASTTNRVTGIGLTGDTTYIDTKDTTVTSNKNHYPISAGELNQGNANNLFYVYSNKKPITINSNIIMNDVGSTAVKADHNGQVNYAGTVNLNSQNTSTGEALPSFGIYADGSYDDPAKNRTTVNLAGNIYINADHGIGIHVREGAKVNILNNAKITFGSEKNQIGVLLSGINTNETNLNFASQEKLMLNGEGSTLFRIERGASFNLANASGSKFYSSNDVDNSSLFVVTNGPAATGHSNQSSLIIDGSQIEISGKNSTAIRTEGGAKTILTKENKILVNGENNTIGRIDGNYYELDGTKRTDHYPGYSNNSILVNQASISNENYTDTAKNSVGFHALNNGLIDNQGMIDFTKHGTGLIGVLLTDGGKLYTEKKSYIRVDGTAVKIVGSAADAEVKNDADNIPRVEAINGTAAYWVTADPTNSADLGGRLILTGSGETLAAGTAHGILVDKAQHIAMKDNAYINMNFDNSTGSGIENRQGLTNIEFNKAKIDVKNGIGIHSAVSFNPTSGTDLSGVINVFGSGTGIKFEDIKTDGSGSGGTTNNAINFTKAKGLVVNVKKDTGTGIYINSNQDVVTSGSVNVLSATGKEAVVVDGTTAKVTQQGNLHSSSSNNIIKLNSKVNTFTNSGDITYGTFDPISVNEDKPIFTKNYSDRIAVSQNAGSDNMTFTNDAGGFINGTVSLLRSGANTVNLNSNSVGNKFVTGSGDDQFNVTGITGADNDGGDHQFRSIDGGAGSNKLLLTNADYMLTNADTIKNVGEITLTNSTLTLDDVVPIDTYLFITNTADKLNYNISKDSIFKPQIKGDGHVLVTGKNRDRNRFDFNEQQRDFRGILELKNTEYNLSGINQSSLENATLRGSEKSNVIVGNGEQDVGNIHMNGGNFAFDKVILDNAVTPGSYQVADSYIKTDDLKLDGGTVSLGVDSVIVNPKPPKTLDAGKASILSQDDNNIQTQLVKAQTVSKTGNDYIAPTPVTSGDAHIPDEVSASVVQDNEMVARAVYGAASSIKTSEVASSYKNGLYLTTGLTEIELKALENDGGNALRLNAFGADDVDARALEAKLTDYKEAGVMTAGDVVITGNKQVILNNSLNDYHGRTIVDAYSSLQSGANHSFGHTSDLNLTRTNGIVDLNGKEETVGTLNTEGSSYLNFNNGILNIDQSNITNFLRSEIQSDVNGDDVLRGAGTLNVRNGSVVAVTGSNTNLTAAVNNNDASTIYVLRGNSLGTGEINMADTSKFVISLDHDDALTNTFAIGSKDAALEKMGRGMLTINNGQATYESMTNLHEGTLRFNGGSVASNTINTDAGSFLRADDATNMRGTVNNSGTFTTGRDVFVQNLNGMNLGSVYVANRPNDTMATRDKLTVGQYKGEKGSRLYFKGALNNDNSVINNLVITNGSSGTSGVYVKNLGGRGAYTDKGILLIKTDKDSNAEYTSPGGNATAGAWEYKLQRGTRQGEDLNDWYLVSRLAKGPTAYYSTYTTAEDVLDMRFQDRLGSKDFIDYVKDADTDKDDAMWTRIVRSKREQNDDSGINHIRNNGTYMQMGYDLARWHDVNARRQFGVMFGYYDGSGVVEAREYDSSQLSLTSKLGTAGLYYSWIKQRNEKDSFYLDTWLQYLWGKNDINSPEFNESYNTKGFATSVEAGYTHVYDANAERSNFIEPKMQFIFNNVKQDSFYEENSPIEYVQDGKNQVIGRVGVRFGTKPKMVPGKTSYTTGYFELNQIHYFNNYKFSVGEDKMDYDLVDKTEAKIGFERQCNKKVSVWGYGFVQVGDHSYTNMGMQLGAKLSF